MVHYRSSLGLGCCLTLILFIVGCASESAPDSTGSLSLDLVLGNSTEIDEVAWRISSGDMVPMEGTIDTSAPGATASVEVYGLPGGDAYLLELSAMSSDGRTTCKGSMNFKVFVGQVTDVYVMLQCQTESDSGAVRVDTRINLCGELIKVVVSPLRTSIGNEIDLSAAADDAEGDVIRYLWTASGGSIANPTAPQTTYTCGQAGQQFVRIQVSDAEHCSDEWTVPVTCVDRSGSGGTSGTGGTAGTGATGGTGGTGGVCQTCGLGNQFPQGGPVDTARLNCSVMGIPVPLDFALTAVAQGAILDGENTITTAFQSIIPEDVVDLVRNLANDATVVATAGRVETGASPEAVELGLSPVPCLVCFVQGTEVVIPNDPRTDTYTVAGGSIDFTLSEVSVTLDLAGLDLVLSNTGNNPACAWDDDAPPSVALGDDTAAGACTNAEDAAIYAEAEYTNDEGQTFFGDAAVAAIANDCLFGSATLTSVGCGAEVGLVLGNNNEANRAALAACVVQCTVDQGIPLSATCLACYGDAVTCGTAFCAGPCAADTNAPACIACRCGANGGDVDCFGNFDACSGLPGGNLCGGGSGGTGGAGGTGGSGGVGGGTGGTGGGPIACQQTCGIGNDFPSGTPVDNATLECSVMGIPIPLDFNLTAFSNGAIVDGDNAVTIAAQTVIPVSVVDLIINLADSADIASTVASVGTTGTPSDVSLMLTSVPCEVCFNQGTEVEVTIDPRTVNLSVSGGSIGLDLDEVTVIIDAAGLQLVLSNVGADPACAWNGTPPSLTLESPTP